jgi:molybdopterin-containing oxidoreductase family iron-sulfur binding subunit
VILNGNPAYDAPADLNWSQLQESVETVVRFGYHVDETSVLSNWHVPAAHYLETWGDGVAADGSYCSQQPLIQPLFAGLSEIQLLAACCGQEIVDGPDEVKQTFARVSGSSSAKAWNVFVRDGFLKKAIKGRASAPAASAASIKAPRALSTDNLEVVFVADQSVDDGRWANNGWMQEVPDPITKITWDNAAYISPKTAQDLGLFFKTIKGVETTDVVEISLGGNSIEIPIIMVPGHPDHTLTLPIGYGRELPGKVAKGVGFDVYPLRSSAQPAFAVGATVKAVGRRHGFAITQEHWSMEGRGIVREAPIDYFRQNPDFVGHLGLESHTPEKNAPDGKPMDQSFYKRPPFDYVNHHQWGMSIDLTTCVGCNACTIACQAENNIPIVGKDQVAKGREMHWIRIDRYYTGASKFESDGGKEEIPNEPEMVTQPILCQHCENAPCETVCPVNATVHNEEGLNVMAYNRCIGTRYCANNCPYKVRRFNWFDYNQRQLDQLYISGRFKELGVMGTIKQPYGPKGTEELIKMSKNPNVTVRMRGVIEKCTFCVQRLEMAKIQHKSSGIRQDGKVITAAQKKLPTDSVKVACQQACPADAIVFGDLSDPESRVNKVRSRQQGYRLLEYLNTQPRITYLARLRNPNPKMPGADLVAMSLINSIHAQHGGGHEAPHGQHDDHAAHPATEHTTGESH